jgi:hypothetical protein
MDTDGLMWAEADVRGGLVRRALDKTFFPNEHVFALVGRVNDWRAKLQTLAEDSVESLIENYHARIIVGMQAEGEMPKPTPAGANDAVQVE